LADAMVDSPAARKEDVAAAGRVGTALPALQAVDKQLLRKERSDLFVICHSLNALFPKIGICQRRRF
jgi:hypothetical protein